MVLIPKFKTIILCCDLYILCYSRSYLSNPIIH